LRRDKYLALEEIRELMGLTHDEAITFFALLDKAEYGNLHFRVCDVCVEFHTYWCRCDSYREGSVCVKTEGSGVSHSVEYQFPEGFSVRSKVRRA